ncbi:MAG: protein kinase, partial [Acidobacteriota bacterium]
MATDRIGAGAGTAARTRARERRGGSRLSLAARIFLITGLLILLAVALAVAVTAWLGLRIAEDDAAAELERTSTLQRSVRDERYQRLWLISDLFSLDPYLSAYIAEAAQSEDTASILDLLAQNQQDLGFDLAMVLTPEGRVLAHTARPDAVGEDLSDQPLVAAALVEYGASGVYRDGGRLFDAVIVPASRGGDLNGFLICGDRIDDALAERILEVSRAEVAYFGASGGRLEPMGSSLDPAALDSLAVQLERAAGGIGRVFTEDRASREWMIELDGQRWLAGATPFRDAAGEVVGGAVTLTSLAEQLATFRELQWVLTGAGAASILLALGLSYPLARRALRPVRSLLRAAEAARRGEYDQQVATGGGDEVARLASAFDDLLSDLRQKRDMEAYMGHLALTVPEEQQESRAAGERAAEGTLVAVELHRHAGPAGDPASAMESLRRDVEEIGRLAAAAGGRVEAVAGHRVFLCFEAEGAPDRALAATTNLLTALRRAGSEDTVRPSIAIVRGRIVRGEVRWSGGSGASVIGLPVRRAEALLREAAPGEVLLTEDAVEHLGRPLRSLGLEPRRQAAILGHHELFVLDPEQVDRLAAAHWPGDTLAVPDRPEPESPLPRIGVGTLLGGRFDVVSELGSGGVGVVFRARDRQLGDTVALKVLRQRFWNDESFLARLKEELRLARRVTHPNVLRTYDFGELDGVPFVSMEYVRGVTLRFLLDRADERLPFTAALSVSRQLCAGLGAAHELGVVHRDVKPENVILDAAGNAKLMDFGLARPAARSGEGLTRAGEVVGTPQYMAPERFGEGDVSARTDVYSCGIILYELFTGGR